MDDIWQKGLSNRAYTNADNCFWSATGLLVDVQSGAFLQRDAVERIDQAILRLSEAKQIQEQRMQQHLEQVRAA